MCLFMPLLKSYSLSYPSWVKDCFKVSSGDTVVIKTRHVAPNFHSKRETTWDWLGTEWAVLERLKEGESCGLEKAFWSRSCRSPSMEALSCCIFVCKTPSLVFFTALYRAGPLAPCAYWAYEMWQIWTHYKYKVHTEFQRFSAFQKGRH